MCEHKNSNTSIKQGDEKQVVGQDWNGVSLLIARYM